MNEALFERVRTRAGFCCEYCRLPEALHPGPFELEHVIALKHGGPSVIGNLAYACPHCNQHKGPNLASIDWSTSRSRLVRLFHPRKHSWRFHFTWRGPELVGRTRIGRVTVAVLAMNENGLLALRAELLDEGIRFSDD